MQRLLPPGSLSPAALATPTLLHFPPTWLAVPSWSRPPPPSPPSASWHVPGFVPSSKRTARGPVVFTDHPYNKDSQVVFASLDLSPDCYPHISKCTFDSSPCTPTRQLKGSLVSTTLDPSSRQNHSESYDLLSKYAAQLST